MTPDSLSGWVTAPAAAREAGDEIYRWFETPEEAKRFIAGPAGNADRQRRLRQRRRENAVALRLTVPEAVVSALIEAGRLSAEASTDKSQVADAAVGVLFEWSKPWDKHFP